MRKFASLESHNFLKQCTFRKDHYDGKNALYRLSAVVDIQTTGNCLIESVQKLTEKLKSLTVVPSEVVVFQERIEIHWYTKGYQMVLNREQYLELLESYLSFIKGIDEFEAKFLDRCLIEDPDRTVWGVPNEIINFKPKFNPECFGLDGNKVKVLFLTEKLEMIA